MYKCNITSSSCCEMLWGKTFFQSVLGLVFSFSSLKEKMPLHKLHIVNSNQSRDCCCERGVRKGPSSGYFSLQFSPGPAWVGDSSHLFRGTGTPMVSPFPPAWDGEDEEGALGRRQQLLGLAGAAAEAASTGVFHRETPRPDGSPQPCAQLACDSSHAVFTSALLHICPFVWPTARFPSLFLV